MFFIQLTWSFLKAHELSDITQWILPCILFPRFLLLGLFRTPNLHIFHIYSRAEQNGHGTHNIQVKKYERTFLPLFFIRNILREEYLLSFPYRSYLYFTINLDCLQVYNKFEPKGKNSLFHLVVSFNPYCSFETCVSITSTSNFHFKEIFLLLHDCHFSFGNVRRIKHLSLPFCSQTLRLKQLSICLAFEKGIWERKTSKGPWCTFLGRIFHPLLAICGKTVILLFYNWLLKIEMFFTSPLPLSLFVIWTRHEKELRFWCTLQTQWGNIFKLSTKESATLLINCLWEQNRS